MNGEVEWWAGLGGASCSQFALEEYIGCGSRGCVYRGTYHSLPGRTDLAIKIEPGDPPPGWEASLEKVHRLARIGNVVHLHGLGVAQLSARGRSHLVRYSVWDYIPPGRSLEQYLLDEPRVPTSFILALLKQILSVLHACDIRGVGGHGDLHSGNILIGDPDSADIDVATGKPRSQIYLADVGVAASSPAGAKDDYAGLATIFNDLMAKVAWEEAPQSDRQLLLGLRALITKTLSETNPDQRQPPAEILSAIRAMEAELGPLGISSPTRIHADTGMNVGQFQVSEMLGDDWEWWRRLFVPTVPARSRVLERDIPSVITGPRGCGKTMLFRRLSERAVIECGPVEGMPGQEATVSFFVSANDISDAFPWFPVDPSQAEAEDLISFANLCVIADVMSVHSAHVTRPAGSRNGLFEKFIADLVLPEGDSAFDGEDPINRLRARIERLKWLFPNPSPAEFPGRRTMGHIGWLGQLFSTVRSQCIWARDRHIVLFVDDYTTPRVNRGMQRVLNRVLLRRDTAYVAKISTEAATTFEPTDLSGKQLQDGEDFRFVDMAEESLFMGEDERARFLRDVMDRRLSLDPRVEDSVSSLESLLGSSNVSKTEFARLLRGDSEMEAPNAGARRGRTRPKVLYHGEDIFCSLWSGDTRSMIQVVQDLLDGVIEHEGPTARVTTMINAEEQDRIYRDHGGKWLSLQSTKPPSRQDVLERALGDFNEGQERPFEFTGGSYGQHLTAVVQAFAACARAVLMKPPYVIRDGAATRSVPRMAFRIEILDDFRLSPLATEIYRDLIRYGMFLRDARGKSVRGAMVPRLYLRRFLLPYCSLPLSKRDSVGMQCAEFERLLLDPDAVKASWVGGRKRKKRSLGSPQTDLLLQDTLPDPAYDDLRG